MKEKLNLILKSIGVYHPLQSFYRSLIFSVNKTFYRNRYAKYKGTGFLCNVCGTSYARFASDHPRPKDAAAIDKHHVIAGYGDTIICPNCLSTARERLVLLMLEKMNISDKNILHFSPEKNIYARLRKQAHVTTADLAPGFYRTIDRSIQHADATRLTYKDEQFDMIIANHIFEHIPDDIAAMKEMFRVLKPGGNAILQIPYSETLHETIESPDINDPARQSALFGQKDHVRIYALEDYISRLRRVGFEVSKIGYDELKEFYKYAIQEDECFLKITKPVENRVW